MKPIYLICGVCGWLNLVKKVEVFDFTNIDPVYKRLNYQYIHCTECDNHMRVNQRRI